MPRIPTALSIAVLLLATACGGSDDSSEDNRARTIEVAPSSAAPEPEGDGEKTLTEAELKAALLTVQDLPTGYTVGTTDDEGEDTTTDGGSEECSEKFEALGEADKQDVSAEAEANFEGPSLGTILEQGLESYEDEDVPQQRFDDVLAVLSECPTFSDTDETGAKTDFTVSSLSFPKMGDDTIALNIKVATADFNGSVNFVVVRLGRNVMSIAQGGLTADVPTLEQAVTKGLEKLAAATE